MAKQYTLEEIKDLVYRGNVSSSNLTDIISSLKDYDFNEEIREIFVSLSNNENLPEAVRINFRNFIDSYSEFVEDQKQEERIINNEDGNNGSEEIELLGDDHTEIVFHEPEITSINTGAAPDTNEEEKDEISLENDAVLGGLMAYAALKGLKVVSNNPGLVGKPEISFELNYESKPYIDNILLSLYENKDDINVDMTRISSTGQEVLTLNIDNPELSEVELQEKSKKLFNDVNEILKSTDDKKDYEAMMPDELKALKDKFHNDDPNIPNEDFKIGYSRSNGENTYYLVANSKEQAIELADLMGYEVKKDRGGNVFELDGQPQVGSKLDVASEPINELDEVKGTDEGRGLSDLDINYNNKHYSFDKYQKIDEFIANSKDPSTMSVIQISKSDSTPDQREVTIASTDGTRETIIFNDGKEFDNYTLPKIASSFAEDATIDQNNVTKVKYEENTTDYEALSSNNTYLRLNGMDSSVVDNIDNSLSQYKVEGRNETNVITNKYAYSKKLGTYPSNYNKESAKTNFATLLVFISVMLFGLFVLYLAFWR